MATSSDFSKIYKIHKYWARKPWRPINKLITTNSKERDIVVDLFVGSGVTALESISQNRNFIGYDLNPIAIFITENTITCDFNEDEFIDELGLIKGELEPLFNQLYAVVDKCVYCGKNLVIDHINIGPKFKGKESGVFYCYNCGKTKIKRELTNQEKDQLNIVYEIDKWVPENNFPLKFYKDRFSYKGVRKITDIFTNKNLYALSELLHCIKSNNLKYEKLFLLAFSNTLLHTSKLKSENVRPLGVNNYWIPDDYFEENVWMRYLDRVNLVIKSKKLLKSKIKKKIGDYKFFNQSSFNTGLEDESVDYIITDPPYGEAIQYSELSLVWNSWLGLNYDNREEVIINPVQDKGKKEFIKLLEMSLKEGRRILKNGKKFTICFHNKEFDIWQDVLSVFKRNGFKLININIESTVSNSYNINWSEFSPKSDLYLTFERGEYFGHTYNKQYSLESLLEDIINKSNIDDCPKIYDMLVSKLLIELYYNEYKINLDGLSIKKLNKIMGEIKSGNQC
ncbi:hypothetical protein MCP_0965 [Methanocella paludicola SANAE]|uniref:DNA methylase N-4/N-6 domain-containing protein n=1 Tax=Methanocella paludicola (strain DSM 17711 / JCM 13418 / NBRC 101707 / SANAE) TaxID=304371 RepID=D1YX65_METPS|nr:DNA methyltransferase [Methanocella paludicola]BAI61037.1 hypothetical protein MCP_0965 [Methanocella paludicola SANAE]